MKKEQSLRLISQALTLLNNTFLYIPIILLASPAVMMRRFKKANTKLNKFVLNHYFLSSLNLVHIVYAHLFNIPVINSNLPLKKIRSQTFNTLRSYLQSKNHTPNDLLSLTADEILLKVKGEFLKQKSLATAYFPR